ncbi:hypothetical protein [Candidatus Sulfurimonas baltica]|uniref:Uncharacterized protein n=1 Tax=Candidatus Sulfurimonas baltica TaxID=2740404 RepID=A0A7S7LWN8_9BACT|nr:hypothetical protein [Candidatus Sulfurimonas baltica]QOY52746.1 hypothetical protein HUE88_03410 [Candidatus Sulfurimonas baltica]
MIARIYTLNEYYKIFEDIFNNTNNYKNNEFRKLIIRMFEIFRTYTYLDNELIIIINSEKEKIKISKNLFESFKFIREFLIAKEIVDSEFNNLKYFTKKYQNNFYNYYDLYVVNNILNEKIESE